MNLKAYLYFAFGLIALGATVFSFMNFWAGVDLGYDSHPKGKMILNGWCYAFIGLCLSTLVLFALAARSWAARRRGHPGT